MNKIKTLLILIAATIMYTSCAKDDSKIDPHRDTLDSVTIMGFKDSTLLIKSIHFIGYDSASGEITDSATRYYFYDTLSRKIILSLQPVSAITQSYDGIEYSYNKTGLLERISWKYLTETPDEGSSFISSDYSYDATNVIKTASVALFGGIKYTISFTKTTLPSDGYRLSWTDSSPYNINGYPGSTDYVADFDKNGKLQKYWNASGNQVTRADSVVYDLNGSFKKLLNIQYFYKSPSGQYPDSTAIDIVYDFISRDTKGDQLYNLNQIMNNGIGNIPNSISYGFVGVDGIDDYVYQYSKFPALSTNINRPLEDDNGNVGNYQVNFSSAPQYDSKDRLVRYRMFFADEEISYTDYIISYYK